MNFSQDCCFFLNLVHSSESKKKLDLGRNFMRTTTTIISSMVSIPWFYSISMYTSVNYCSIHNKTYIQYLLLYVYIYICAPHNISIWFSILGNKHFVGTTHEQHVYKKTLSLSKISSFGPFPPFHQRLKPLKAAVPWVMGVWNLGVGAGWAELCSGLSARKNIPRWQKRTHDTVYNPENSWISPKKGGPVQKERIVLQFAIFQGTCGCFLGVFLLGCSYGSRDASFNKNKSRLNCGCSLKPLRNDLHFPLVS